MTAAVRLDDPELEPHHLEVTIGEAVGIVALTGRPPQAVGSGPDADQDQVWSVADTTFEIGRPSDLGWRPAGESATVVRRRRDASDDPVAAIGPLAAARAAATEIRQRPPTATGAGAAGLLGAGMSVVVATVMALVIGQVMFLLFAASGVVVALVGWWSARRRRRTERRRREAEVAAAEDHLRATRVEVTGRVSMAHRRRVPWVAERLASVDSDRLWERRRCHGDALTVTIGEGRWEYIGAGGESLGLEPVAVPVDIAAHRVLGVTGPAAAAVIRSVIAQLAVQAGPADWVLLDRCDHPLAPGVAVLPHLIDADRVGSMFDRGAERSTTEPHLVVVTDRDADLTRPGTALRRLVAEGVTVLALIGDPTRVPAVCDAVFHTGRHASGRFDHGSGSHRVRIAGVTATTLDIVAAHLIGRIDPEATADATVPDRVSLAELIPTTPATIDAAWNRFDRCGASIPAVVGVDEGGPFVVDVVADGPHGLIAGTTGSGKSEFLRTLVLSMAVSAPPDELNVVLVDYKGGATFDACVALPHTVGVVTDLDDGLAERALLSLDAELRHRELLLRRHGVGDRRAYATRRLDDPSLEPLPRLVVIIDEFATMVREVPGFISSLVGVAQRGRSLGLHLLLATQRPAGVLDDAIRANTDLRIALRVNDVADAHDVVGSPLPARFARSTPGRAMVRCGSEQVTVVQTASSADLIDDVAAAVVVAATARTDLAPPRRPWLPALAEIDDEELADLCRATPGAIGVIDDPAGQRRLPLAWDRSGNLALVGSPNSAASATLRALLAAMGGPVAMIDAIGVQAVPGAVHPDDHERVERLLGDWCAEIDRRRRGRDRDAVWVLAIDGVVPLVRRLEDRPRARDRLERILGEGPAVGVIVAATIDSGRGASIVGRFADRWVFHLDDPSEGLLFGLPAALVPRADQPADQFVIAATRLVARVDLRSSATGDPTLVEIGALGSDIVGVDGFAVRFDDLTAMTPELAPSRSGDEHVMILGPPRSGRTTALVSLVDRLGRMHPTTPILWCDDVEMMVSIDGPAIVVVDDAEAIDDADGVLARWLETAIAGRMVIAAGRPDVLRTRYGHWTAALRRSRRGLVLAATADTDTDLLGIVPPRVAPIRPRPGLGWWIEPGGSAPALVQVARRAGEGAER